MSKKRERFLMPNSELSDLEAIVKTCHDIAGDISAYGPHIRDEVFQDSIGDISQLISNTREELECLLGVLRNKKDGYMKAQLHLLGIETDADNLKLNIGSSCNSIHGWINIDFFHPGLSMNLNWPLPFKDNSINNVFFCLALEHFFYKSQAHRILSEIFRVMKEGATVRVVVPDIEKYLHAYVEDRGTFFESHKRIWSWSKVLNTPLEHIMAWVGLSQESPSFFGHKMGYDFATLSNLLADAGFSDITRHDFMEGSDTELLMDEWSKDASHGYNKVNFNLFVEAKKNHQKANPQTSLF